MAEFMRSTIIVKLRSKAHPSAEDIISELLSASDWVQSVIVTAPEDEVHITSPHGGLKAPRVTADTRVTLTITAGNEGGADSA